MTLKLPCILYTSTVYLRIIHECAL